MSSADIGVDRLSWEITDHPEGACSTRFSPGTPAYDAIRYEIWDVSGLGNAIPGATPRARLEMVSLLHGVPVVGRAGRTVRVKTRVHNTSARALIAKVRCNPRTNPRRCEAELR
jgi:hypothetical protein